MDDSDSLVFWLLFIGVVLGAVTTGGIVELTNTALPPGWCERAVAPTTDCIYSEKGREWRVQDGLGRVLMDEEGFYPKGRE